MAAEVARASEPERPSGQHLSNHLPASQELLKETRKEHTLRAVQLLYSIFCLDMQQVTLVLLGHILPGLLTDSSKWHSLMDPPGTALAKLAVWCALSSYSSHKGQASSRQKKRHREDIEVCLLLTWP